MSLILDALRRSEERREALDLPKPPPPRRAAGRSRRLSQGGALLVLVAVAAAAVVALSWPDAAPEQPPEQLPGAAVTRTQAPDPGTAALVAAPEPSGVDDAGPEPRQTSPALRPIIPQSTGQETDGAGSGAIAADGEPQTAETSEDPERVPYLGELPVPFQAKLAGLKVQAHVWHSDRDRRFVMIDGRRYREGETLSAGPVVETITREGLVLAWQGRRFRLARS